MSIEEVEAKNGPASAAARCSKSGLVLALTANFAATSSTAFIKVICYLSPVSVFLDFRGPSGNILCYFRRDEETCGSGNGIEGHKHEDQR